jgi:DNA mismatch repair protein MutS2
VLAEVNRIRVIHGHGMNVLRKALWQMFANHVHVERYYQAEQHEGGAGATIVEVKES